MLATGKLGGILVESKTLGEEIQFVVIGIGLNIDQPTTLLPLGATSLRIACVRVNRQRLLREIVDQLRFRLDDLEDPPKVLQEWWHNCVHPSLWWI